MPLDMLPRVRYTGQACLLPPNCERFILSVARMTGTNMAPFGNLSFDKRRTSDRVQVYCSSDRATYLSLPPPLSCPHLIVSPRITLLISKHLLAVVCQVIMKHRISHELSDALYRITNPQLAFLHEKLIVFIP
jgi:hypothetical protein